MAGLHRQTKGVAWHGMAQHGSGVQWQASTMAWLSLAHTWGGQHARFQGGSANVTQHRVQLRCQHLWRHGVHRLHAARVLGGDRGDGAHAKGAARHEGLQQEEGGALSSCPTPSRHQRSCPAASQRSCSAACQRACPHLQVCLDAGASPAVRPSHRQHGRHRRGGRARPKQKRSHLVPAGCLVQHGRGGAACMHPPVTQD